MDDHTVVGRAVAILDCVASATGPLALAALTRRTGIPKPTVRRIANDLVERDMLELTSEGYRAGSRLINQGLQSVHRQGTVLATQPYLQDLHLQTRGELAFFASLDDGELKTTAAAFGRSHVSVMRGLVYPGMSRLGPSMVVLAAGRLQVAHAPEDAERIMSTGWAPLTPYSVIERHRLRDLLREAHDTGFAQESEQTILGWSCMVAALRDSAGRLAGALGVAGRSANIEAKGVRPALRRFAESLETELIPRSAEAS